MVGKTMHTPPILVQKNLHPSPLGGKYKLDSSKLTWQPRAPLMGLYNDLSINPCLKWPLLCMEILIRIW